MSTNWSNNTIQSTNWNNSDGSSSATLGTPIGLLLLLTVETNVVTPGVSNSIDYSQQTINSTNWDSDSTFAGFLLLESGDNLLLENGDKIRLE